MAKGKGKGKKSGVRSKKLSITGAAPLIYMGAVAYNGYQTGGIKQMANDVIARTTGWSMIGNHWKGDYLVPTGMVVGSSFVAHKVASIAQVNRYIPKWLPIKF